MGPHKKPGPSGFDTTHPDRYAIFEQLLPYKHQRPAPLSLLQTMPAEIQSCDNLRLGVHQTDTES